MNCNTKIPFSQGGSFNVKMGQVNAVSSNYNTLNNKPSINGITLIGNKTSEELGLSDDKHFIFVQSVASDAWEIKHDLNKYPSVTIVDSADSIVIGDVAYIDENNVRLTFSGAFSGKAYLN